VLGDEEIPTGVARLKVASGLLMGKAWEPARMEKRPMEV